MSTRFLIGLLAFFLVERISAQSPAIDSLRNLLATASGTQRVDVLNAYGYIILSYDYQHSQKLINEAFDLANSLDYKKGLAESLLYKGTIEDRTGKDSSAHRFFTKALDLSRDINNPYLAARILTAIGRAIQYTDQPDSAEVYYDQAYQILKDSANPLYLSYLYLRLAEINGIKNNQDLRLSYLKKSLEIRKNLVEKHPLVWACVALSAFYSEQGKFDEALSHLDYAQKSLGRDTVNSEEYAIICKNRAIVSAGLGNHAAAQDLFAKARKFYEKNPFPWDLVNILMEMGITQSEVSNYEISLKYFFQALRLAEIHHYERFYSKLYFQIARVYYFLGQGAQTEQYCNKALSAASFHTELEEAMVLNLLGTLATRKHQFKEGLNYLNKALSLRQKNYNKKGIAGTLGCLGELYIEMGNYKKAEGYSLQSLAIEEEIGDALNMSFSYSALGQLYFGMKDYNNAMHYLDLGEDLTKKTNSLEPLSKIYKIKRDIFLAQKDYKQAVHYSMLYETLKDSLVNKNLANRILTLQHGFELEQKDNEIKILNQQRLLQQNTLALQQAQIKQQWVYIVIGIVISLIAAAVAYIIFGFYRKVKSLNRSISEKTEEIQAQAEELTESNQTIARINEGLEEKVKQRTSELKDAYHELDTFFYRSSHDFRRPLTTFMGLAEVAKVSVKDQAALELFDKVRETANNLDKMLSKLQSVNLASSTGLVQTEVHFKDIFESELHYFQNELLKKKIIATTEVNVTTPLHSYPALIKVIVQNLIENAIAFSAEDRPVIHLAVLENRSEIELRVTDNGQGIDSAYLPRIYEMYFRANERSTGNGLGLYIVKKMADRLGAHIETTSSAGKGTTTRIFFSLK